MARKQDCFDGHAPYDVFEIVAGNCDDVCVPVSQAPDIPFQNFNLKFRWELLRFKGLSFFVIMLKIFTVDGRKNKRKLINFLLKSNYFVHLMTVSN